MKVSKSMEEIWRIKEKIGRELEGKTDEEILAYFRDREPEWSKALPILKRDESVGGDTKASASQDLRQG